MNKPILFVDFDGTLCYDRFWRSLPPEQYEKVQELLFGEDRQYLQEWMKGKRTAEEVNQLLAEQLGIPFEDIWEVFDLQSVKTRQYKKTLSGPFMKLGGGAGNWTPVRISL